MAAALQQRVERDARFASDVSHELRSPLMTLSASIDVMEARRDEMPERAQAALDLLVSDVARFRGLVEDLLEISRFDAGAIRLNLEDLRVSQFVRNAVAVSSAPTLEVTTSAAGRETRSSAATAAGWPESSPTSSTTPSPTAPGSRRSASRTAMRQRDVLTHVKIAVEDHGPGVPVEERALIFERFSRGISAGQRSGSEGAGLGLALVDEHIRLHDGRVWVEDRTDGQPGARFVIELPARMPIDYVAEPPDEDDGTPDATASRVRRERAAVARVRTAVVAACATAAVVARRRLRDPAGLGAAGHPRRSAGAGNAVGHGGRRRRPRFRPHLPAGAATAPSNRCAPSSATPTTMPRRC